MTTLTAGVWLATTIAFLFFLIGWVLGRSRLAKSIAATEHAAAELARLAEKHATPPVPAWTDAPAAPIPAERLVRVEKGVQAATQAVSQATQAQSPVRPWPLPDLPVKQVIRAVKTGRHRSEDESGVEHTRLLKAVPSRTQESA